MSLIKKIDVDKHFAARRAMRLGRSGPLSQAGAGVLRTAKATGAAAFIEDVAPAPIAADVDAISASSASRNREA
jgi:hypothetical protein